MRGGASVCMERGISARRRYAALRVARTGALDERGHGGGDHPVPFRTRQLSPPSPDVLRGKPVGGRAAALAQRARTRAPAHRRPRHARGPPVFPAMRSGVSKAPPRAGPFSFPFRIGAPLFLVVADFPGPCARRSGLIVPSRAGRPLPAHALLYCFAIYV